MDAATDKAAPRPGVAWEKPLAYFWTGLSAAGWLLYFIVTLRVPPHAGGPLLAAQLGALVLGVTALMAILLAGERPRWPAGGRWALFCCGVALIGVAFFLNARPPELRAWLALGLMAVALPIGYWVGDRMEKVTNLIPVAVAFTCADIYSVFQGPSKRVVEQLSAFEQEVAQRVAEAVAATAPEQAREAAARAAALVRAPLADYVVVHFPVPGTGASQPVLGVGDFVIMAVLFRVAWVHGLSPLTMLVASVASTLAALAVSHLTDTALPALPFIAVGVIGWLLATNPRLRRLDRQELVLSILVAALFIALMGARWLRALVS